LPEETDLFAKYMLVCLERRSKMEFKNGANIYTFDGKGAGSLRRVVINPETKKITHIVIEKGLLFKEDKVVPVGQVDSASQEQVNLICTLEELKEMSSLDIEFDVPLGTSTKRDLTYDPLMGKMYWTTKPSIIKQTKRTISNELVALKEGARVVSRDDEHVGNVERVFTEPNSGKVSHFILSHGLLHKTRKSVPINWVNILAEDEVHLIVGTRQVEELTAIMDPIKR